MVQRRFQKRPMFRCGRLRQLPMRSRVLPLPHALRVYEIQGSAGFSPQKVLSTANPYSSCSIVLARFSSADACKQQRSCLPCCQPLCSIGVAGSSLRNLVLLFTKTHGGQLAVSCRLHPCLEITHYDPFHTAPEQGGQDPTGKILCSPGRVREAWPGV